MTEEGLTPYLNFVLEKTRQEFYGNKVILCDVFNGGYDYLYVNSGITENKGNAISSEVLSSGYVYIKIFFLSKYIHLKFCISIDHFSYVSPSMKDNNSDYFFLLDEYLIYRKPDFNRITCFPKCDLSEIETAFDPFFAELKKLIATDEMQKLLNTDYKIEIPNWVKWEMIGK
ncbi:MAG: hypothetical protein HUJ97_08850 [Bacteroidales bacterium]|nr:hypothetical protein [Clostridia bacterium]MCF0180331.1 hypothetical protein [Bacteroidales bacterium]